MKKTRILALALVAVMLCSVFAGCDMLGGKTVLKIGGANISEKIFSAAVSQVGMYMQNSGFVIPDMLDMELAEGQTGADLVKSEAEGILREFETIRLLAKENGITLSKEDKKTLADQKKSQIDAEGGKKAFLDKLAEGGANEAFYDYLMESQLLYSKVYSELFVAEDGAFAPTAEELAAAFADGYVCVKHVLIQGKETDADYGEKRAKAEEVAKRAKAGEDFDALVAEFGEDPGMTQSKGGYVMDMQGYTPTGSMMVQEFTTASVALPVGGVSDIVKSDFGFHIIKRYPISAEHIATDFEGFKAQLGGAIFTEEVMKFMETVEVERTAAYDEFDVHKVFGAEKTLGAGVDEESHEGHDHASEGEELPEITLTPAE